MQNDLDRPSADTASAEQSDNQEPGSAEPTGGRPSTPRDPLLARISAFFDRCVLRDHRQYEDDDD